MNTDENNHHATTPYVIDTSASTPLPATPQFAPTYLQMVSNYVGIEKINFSPADNATFAIAVVAKFLETLGLDSNIGDEEQNRLRLIFGPSEAVKQLELERILAARGVTTPADLGTLLKLQFDTTRFEQHLAKKKNPATGKPFITIKKRERASDAFDVLLGKGQAQGNEEVQ